MKRPEDLGVHVIYTGPQIADAKHQIEVIEELIGQEVDLLAVAANDPVKLLPVLEKARNEGIRVITWDSDTRPEGRTFFVNQVDAETFGRHLMDTLAMNVEGEKGPFAIVTGSLSAANLNEWIKWIQVQQKEFYPGMELVDIVPNDENAQKGFERTMELLERHPDLKGIIGSNSLGPLVAAQAVRAKGLSEEVAVVGASPPVSSGIISRKGLSISPACGVRRSWATSRSCSENSCWTDKCRTTVRKWKTWAAFG